MNLMKNSTNQMKTCKKILWLSSPYVTFVVEVDEDGLITKPAPICWKWRKRPVEDLIKQFHIDCIEEIKQKE